MPAYENQKTFVSDAVAIAADSTVSVRCYGAIKPGLIWVLLQGADGLYHRMSDLRFRDSAMVNLDLRAGDSIKVEFDGCSNASVELLT